MRNFTKFVSFLFIVGLILFSTCNQNILQGGGSSSDLTPPTLEVTSNVSGEFVGPTFIMSGTATDNISVASVGIEYIHSTDGDTFTATLASPNTKSTTWSKTFTLTDLNGDGEKRFEITVKDSAGNSFSRSLYLTVDKDAPLINIDEPTIIDPTIHPDIDAFIAGLDRNSFDNIKYFLNGDFDIVVSVNDAFPIKKTTLQLYENGITSVDPAIEATIEKNDDFEIVTPATNDVTADGSPAKATFSLNVPELIAAGDLSDDTKYSVRILTYDMASNEGNLNPSFMATEGYIYIDQDMDNPRTKIQSPSSGTSTFPQSTATGNSFDDDGLEKVYWYAGKVAPNPDYTQWKTLYGDPTGDYAVGGVFDLSADNPKVYSWQFETPQGTGPYEIHIRPVDMYGNVPATDTVTTYTQATSSDPVLSIVGPDPSQVHTGTITVTVNADGAGDNVDTIYYTVKSTGLGITDNFTENIASPQPTLSGYTFTVDTTTYVDATHQSFSITAHCETDGATASQSVTINLLADNTAPTVSITSPPSPSGTTVINGDKQTILGECSDWSTVDAVYIGYFVDGATEIVNYTTEADFAGNWVESPATPLQDQWYKISSPGVSWYHNFNTEIVEPSTTGRINPYRLYVAAIDKVGNVSSTYLEYDLDQDADRPKVTVTNPSSTGVNLTSPWLTVDKIGKFGSDFLIMGTSQDDDGVQEVQISVDLMDFTGSGHSVNSSIISNTVATGTTNWSYSISGLAECAKDGSQNFTQYYRISVTVEDIMGRVESGSDAYFIVSNEVPEIEFLWPSTFDPDSDTLGGSAVLDSYGTIISNVKDDIYWDTILTNNQMYYNDSTKYFFGWDNTVSDTVTYSGDTPDESGVTYTDFSEATGQLTIFNNDSPDADRSDYFRIIFKARDPNDGGNLTKVEFSDDSGATYETMFTLDHSNDVYTTAYPTKYAFKDSNNDGIPDKDGDKYITFYINFDTTDINLGDSEILKIKVTDNNQPQAYVNIYSVQLNFDNTAPSTSIVTWGTQDTDSTSTIDKTDKYMLGEALDDLAGIRHITVYFWNNQEADPDAAPDYNSSASSFAGALTASVTSGTHYVSIPDDKGSAIDSSGTGDPGDISPANTNNHYPNYWVKAYMYTPQSWKIDDLYDWAYTKNGEKYYGINTKYGVNPIDGKKLVCVEATDNAGNVTRLFEEVDFGEYAPLINTAETYVKWKANEDRNGSVTDSTLYSEALNGETDSTADTIYVSNLLQMSGKISDSKAGDANPGINRVRVYLYRDSDDSLMDTWGTDTGEITGTGLIGTGADERTWNLAEQDVSAYSGLYYAIIEVRDVSGVITTRTQYINIDNDEPLLIVSHPLDGQGVIGKLKIDGSSPTSTVRVEIVNSSDTVLKYWILTPDGSDNWSTVWTVDDVQTTGWDYVRVFAYDEAKNMTLIDRDVILDVNPPYFNKMNITGSVTVDGSSAGVYQNFVNLYKNSNSYLSNSLTEIKMVNANPTLDVEVRDISNGDEITDSSYQIVGYEQSGTEYTGTETALNPNTDSTYATFYTVGDGSDYSATLNNGEYYYQVWIQQNSSKELYIDSNASDIPIAYFIVDKQRPHVWILDMSDDDYVDAGTVANPNPKGHVDTQLDTDGTYAADHADDVSGVVKIKVKVYDNYLVDYVQVRMTNYDFASGGNNTWVTIASRNSAGTLGGTGRDTGNVDSINYWKSTVVGDSLAENENWVELELEFNTARVSDVANLGETLQIQAFDAAGNQVNTGSTSSEYTAGTGDPEVDFTNLSTSPQSTYQAIAAKPLDVVPYITSISTQAQTALGGIKDNNVRSVNGYYSIKTGATNNFITVTGFNLNPITNGVRVSSSTYKSGLDGTTLVGQNVTFTAGGSPYTGLTVSNNIPESGYFSVVCGTAVAPVATINNINSDTKASNMEPDQDSGNLLLTDTRYFRMFSVTNTSFTSSFYPEMMMETDQPIFGFVQGGAALDLQIRRNTNNSSSFGLCRILAADQLAMDKDDQGFYHFATINNFSGGNLVYFYNRYADLYNTNIGNGYTSNNGATSPYWSNYPAAGQLSSEDGNNAIDLDDVNYTPGLQLGRYVNLNMTVRGNSNTAGQYARVYLAFYDISTGEIIFRNFRVGQDVGTNNNNLYSGGESNQAELSFTTSGAASRHIVGYDPGGGFTANSASSYLAMGVTDNNVVVIVYYNQSTGYLNYVYSTTTDGGTTPQSIDLANPDTTVYWSQPIQLDVQYTGWYISLYIDTDGNTGTEDPIHIAAYDTADADLMYIYMTDYLDTSPSITSARVDSKRSVGIYTDIELNGGVPYIAYYNNSENGTRDSIKLAYFEGTMPTVTDGADDTTGNFTGDWECMTIPVNTAPQGGLNKFMKVNLEFDSAGRPVIGYAGDQLEYVIPEDETP